ncbi:MAG TPA: acyl-CoA dehydrogenase family protein [Acidimicrobiales bacterium]|nr:acyl-CoA dehydrogenase family protein [Acidimicrobiales bacterium]
MNLEPTEEQLALRDSVRRFLADKAPIAGHVRPLLEDPTGTTDDVWHGLAELGATGLLVPAEHGGAEMSMAEAGVVLEELGRALYPGPWQSTAVISARLLARLADGGDGSEAAKLLRRIAEGSVIATVAAHNGTVTANGEGGDSADAVLFGDVASVPDAAAAGVLLVPAAEGDRSVLFALESPSPGVGIAPQHPADGTRKRGAVVLQGAPACRLGTLSPGAQGALVDDVLVASAADALGAAQAVLELAVDYAKVRVQFGAPIGSFQAVQHLCVDMLETVELARSGVVHALWAADAADPEERHLAAVRLKAFAGRLAAVGDTAIQVLGGIGFTWEHDAHLYLKRLLSWSALLGSPDHYLQELGSRLVQSVQTAPSRT